MYTTHNISSDTDTQQIPGRHPIAIVPSSRRDRLWLRGAEHSSVMRPPLRARGDQLRARGPEMVIADTRLMLAAPRVAAAFVCLRVLYPRSGCVDGGSHNPSRPWMRAQRARPVDGRSSGGRSGAMTLRCKLRRTGTGGGGGRETRDCG